MRAQSGPSFMMIGFFAVLMLVWTWVLPAHSEALAPPQEKANLLFSNGGRIVSVKADGSDRRVLTRRGKVVHQFSGKPSGDRLPRISPDGTKMLFFRETSPSFGEPLHADGKTMLANSDGTGVREVLKAKRNTTYREVAWMPDGSIVAAKSVRRGRKLGFRRESSVVTMNLDGSGERTVFKLKPHLWRNPKTDLSTNRLPTEIAPSPDGSHLLVTIQNGYQNHDRKLELVSVADGKRKQVAGRSYSGSWSPDGQRIVFASDRVTMSRVCSLESGCRIAGDLYTSGPDGSDEVRLTKTWADESHPDWSPDGQTIAFASTRNRPARAVAAEIYTVKSDGSCLTWLTNGSPASVTPSWSNEGTSEAGTCGAAGGEPLVEGIPARKTSVPLKPRLWPGSQSRGALYSGGIEAFGISLLNYEDCGSFAARECPPQVQVVSASTCLIQGMVPFALAMMPRGQKLKKRRGVVVFQEKIDGDVTTFVLSGGSVTVIGGIFGLIGLSNGDAPTGKQQLEQVDQLRAVGAPLGRKLPPMLIPASDVKSARKTRRVFRRAGSLRLAAKRLKTNRAVVRMNLSLWRNARRFGGVRPMKCPKGSSVVDLLSEEIGTLAAASPGRGSLRTLRRVSERFPLDLGMAGRIAGQLAGKDAQGLLQWGKNHLP